MSELRLSIVGQQRGGLLQNRSGTRVVRIFGKNPTPLQVRGAMVGLQLSRRLEVFRGQRDTVELLTRLAPKEVQASLRWRVLRVLKRRSKMQDGLGQTAVECERERQSFVGRSQPTIQV